MAIISLLRFSFAFVSLLCGVYASAQSATPILVELFTSEGCSSCPPADTLLRTLDSTQPVPRAQLIVLSEHVDYWDDLGWRDPYSSHAFTTRQQEYASRLGLASAYTPQMVVDGKIQFVGNDRSLANLAFEKERLTPKVAVRISSIAIANHTVRVRIETGPLSSKGEIFIVLALEHASSQVLRGENGGHRLEHVAVVRRLTRVGRAVQGEAFSKEVSLALDPSDQPARVIAFAQEQNQGRILGAAVETLKH
jgi:hypothetical protein